MFQHFNYESLQEKKKIYINFFYVLISIIVAVYCSASGIVTIYSPHFDRMNSMKFLNLLSSIFPYLTMSLSHKSLRFSLLCHIGRRIIHGTVQIHMYDFPTPIWSNSSLIKGLVMSTLNIPLERIID